VDSLLKWDFIDEIIIKDNNKGDNIINYGRYTSAEHAKNEIIYTQDDDCIVNNLDQVYKKFVEDPSKICHSGTEEYKEVIPQNIYGDCQMAMAGWGSFFKKEWIPVLKKYTEKYGQDRCFYRETDRIFSILLKKHHNFVLGDIMMLDGYKGPEALCMQPDHLLFKKIAIERALQLAE
jgi:hypothetical protein